MEKQELFLELKNKLSSGEITLTEINSLLNNQTKTSTATVSDVEHKKNISLTVDVDPINFK